MSEIRVRPIAWVAAALLATVVAVVAAVFVLLHHWQLAPGADRMHLPYTLELTGPALQSAPQPELDATLAAQRRVLDSYGWVDAARGIVHIPIDEAMRLRVRQAAAAASAGSRQ